MSTAHLDINIMKAFNPLPINDAYMHHEPHKPRRIYMGGLILGINTLYRLFCFLKQFPMVGKGLRAMVQKIIGPNYQSTYKDFQ